MADNFLVMQYYQYNDCSSVFISFICSKMSTLCKSYIVYENLKIVTFAESEGNGKAVPHFLVGKSNKRLWGKQKRTLKLMLKNKRVDCGKCA